MASVVRVQKGGDVPLYLVCREIRDDSSDGQLFTPNGATITIQHPDATSQTVATGMNWISAGKFLYHWNTASLPAGDYLAKVRFGQAYSSGSGGSTIFAERDYILRLVGVL